MDNNEVKQETKEQNNLRREKIIAEYNKAETNKQMILNKMQEIFEEEANRRETEGPFTTEEELDNFNSYYMNLKQVQNDLYIQNKKQLEFLKKSIEIIDKQKKISPPEVKKRKNISYTPKNTKLTTQKEERLVVADDIKALGPISTKEKSELSTSSPESSEENLIAKKIELKESTSQHKKSSSEHNPSRKKHRIELVEEIFYDEEPHTKLQASHIDVSKKFQDEVNSNNVLYNIIKKVPVLIKTPFKLFKRLSDRIINSNFAKKKIEKLKEKIKNYSNSEIETLNEALGQKNSSFPTISKVLIAEEANRKKQDANGNAQVDVKIPSDTIETIDEQVNSAFRQAEISERESNEKNETLSKSVEQTTPAEILAEFDKYINESPVEKYFSQSKKK